MSLLHLPEDFMHYVWRTLSLEVRQLRTTLGLPVQIIQRGHWNHDQGPDFLEAELRIGGMTWHGAVEMHLRSEDWYHHGHQDDPAYNGVILHVVLSPGSRPVCRADGTEVPELDLSPALVPGLAERYDRIRLSQTRIPCEELAGQVPAFHRRAWLQRMAMERLSQKAATLQARLQAEVQDWEQVLWEELMAMLGGPVNGDAFRTLAAYLPFRLLRSYRKPEEWESWLFGGAGCLHGAMPDAYFSTLQAQWRFLQQKHAWPDPSPVPLRFLRLRPAAFPTLRLAQVANWLAANPGLIDLLQPEQWSDFLGQQIGTTPYWDQHYRPGKPGSARPKRLGRAQKQVLISNVLLPLSYLYHQAHGRPDPASLLEAGLMALAPEENRHTRAFTQLGWDNTHAFDSQGLIQLKKQYCDAQRCLECGIGHQVLKRGS
ncbi:MAG: DUF2851 family protein [Bacteroidetes bacterium]|nr:MAG: DUF2851 family protein [Bacteroidota bacterium]